MDLCIYTAAPDKSLAAVTSTTDLTRVVNLEQLVLGDTPLLNITFTDGSAAPSWAGASGYSLAVALGTLDVNGQSDATTATEFDSITGGWSGRIPLTTQFLIDQVALAVGSAVDWSRFPYASRIPGPRPFGGWFILQIKVTDPDGNGITYAELRSFVRNRVLPAVPEASPFTVPLLRIGPSAHDRDSTAQESVNIEFGSQIHSETITVTGLATPRDFIVQNRETVIPGARMDLLVLFPARATNGTLIRIWRTDGNLTRGVFSFTRSGDEPNALFVLYKNDARDIVGKQAVIPAFDDV